MFYSFMVSPGLRTYRIEYLVQRFWNFISDNLNTGVEVLTLNETPDREKCMASIISYIDNAKVCIDVAMLMVSDTFILKAIQNAVKRGVIVRFLLDHDMMYSRGSKVVYFLQGGAKIRSTPEKVFLHHKFCSIDCEQRILQLDAEEKRLRPRSAKSFVITGSLNWTQQGTRRNYENVLIISDPKLTASYQTLYDKCWESFRYISMDDFNELL